MTPASSNRPEGEARLSDHRLDRAPLMYKLRGAEQQDPLSRSLPALRWGAVVSEPGQRAGQRARSARWRGLVQLWCSYGTAVVQRWCSRGAAL
jgi:hypothetical protein